MKVIVATLVCLFSYSNAYSLFDDESNQCKVVNGNWGTWGAWHYCSVTCGSGIKKRYRHCDNPRPMYGGKKCEEGDHAETAPCDAERACPIDGSWGEWEAGSCSVTCGKGTRKHIRKCNYPPPQHCGKPCDGENLRHEECVMPKCEIDGNWAGWNCEACSRNKDGGCVKHCTRTCTNPPPSDGGNDCEGESSKYETCNEELHCQDTMIREVCKTCSNKVKEGNSVGLACRVDKAVCKNLKGGIKDMYAANDWFFLHCSPDGPWCKPCAEKSLVFNSKCGQCESERYGECTGPNKWDKNSKRSKILEMDNDFW